MAFTPYDWQQTLRQKADYVLDRLREGSPAVGLSCPEGILLFTVRQGSQRKIFEIYDRLALVSLGNPSDLEAVRQAAVDFAHAEGFQRSPEDVSIQRLVGFAISPALKRSFADPFRAPLVLRGLFAQLGEAPEDDLFFVLRYDGEFQVLQGQAAIAGTEGAEQQMARLLEGFSGKLEEALPRAAHAWAVGRWASRHGDGGEPRASTEAKADRSREESPPPSEEDWQGLLREELERGTVEAALLERHTHRERRFRPLSPEELHLTALTRIRRGRSEK